MIQEAAKIGLYGYEALAQFWSDESACRCRSPTRSSSGATPGSGCRSWAPRSRVAAIFGQATPEQMAEWIPRCFGDETDVKVAAFCSSEPDAGSDVSAMRTTAKYDEAKDEWVLNGAEGLGDQRRHRRRPRRHRRRRPRAGLAWPGGLRRLDRHRWDRAGHEGEEARHPRLAHRRRPPRRLPDPGREPARRQGEARRASRPRARGQEVEVPGGDADLRDEPARPSARRPSASPGRPTSTRSTTPRSASSSAGRSSRTRRSPSRSPT